MWHVLLFLQRRQQVGKYWILYHLQVEMQSIKLLVDWVVEEG